MESTQSLMECAYTFVSLSRLYALVSLARCPFIEMLNAVDVLYSEADALVRGNVSGCMPYAGDICFVFEGTVNFANDESAVFLSGTVRPDFISKEFALPFCVSLPDDLLRDYVDWNGDVSDSVEKSLLSAAANVFAQQFAAIALERQFTKLGLVPQRKMPEDPSLRQEENIVEDDGEQL